MHNITADELFSICPASELESGQIARVVDGSFIGQFVIKTDEGLTWLNDGITTPRNDAASFIVRPVSPGSVLTITVGE